MPPSPDPNKPRAQRPWWTGSRPAWKSPWSLDEDELEPEDQPVKMADAPFGSGVEEQKAAVPLPFSVRPEEVRPVERAMEEKARHVESPRRLEEEVRVEKPVEVQRERFVAMEGRPGVVQADDREEDEREEDEEIDEDRRNPPRRRTPKRQGTSWTSLVLMAMAVLGMTFVAWLYVTDSGEVEDKDLMLATAADLMPTITAPGRLEVFLNSVVPVPTPDLMGKAPWHWDTASMENWLGQNSQALDNLKDLLEDFDWHGRHASWHFTDLGGHPNWTAAIILKQVEAAYMQRDGKWEAALAAAVDLAEMARRLQDIHAWPSFYFRSLETHRRCTDTLAELLQRNMADEEALTSFQEQFEACAPQDEHVRRNVLPGFYLFEKKKLLGVKSGEPLDTMPGGVQRPLPKQLFFKTNETLGLMASTIRHLVRQVGQASASTAMMREIWEGVPGTREVAGYQPNGRGAAYARQQLEPYLDVPARQQLARTRHLLVVQLFAIRRFVAVEKGLPESLAGLRPRYLKELPADPYSGEPFHYDAAKGIVYSAGTDVTPEGGRVELAPLADPKEPTIKIGVQKAAVAR